MKFQDLLNMSIDIKKPKQVESIHSFRIEGAEWISYEVSICNRDLLFLCDHGTVTILVDTYNGVNVGEVFTWEPDNE